MSPVQGVGGAGAVVDVSNADIDTQSLFLLAMFARITSLDGDLQSQAADIQLRNSIKKLYNDKLTQLDGLMEQAAAAKQGGDGTTPVTINVPSDQFPWKDYKAVKQDDGSMALVPTSETGDNEVSESYQYTLSAPPGSDAYKTMKNDPSHYKYDAATDTFTTKVQDYATYVTPLLAHGATCTGYALSVSPNALDKAADSLKTQIDSLNTDGEMATLRLNDLLNKTQTATQMTSNLISTFGKMMDGIVQNLRG